MEVACFVVVRGVLVSTCLSVYLSVSYVPVREACVPPCVFVCFATRTRGSYVCWYLSSTAGGVIMIFTRPFLDVWVTVFPARLKPDGEHTLAHREHTHEDMMNGPSCFLG